MRSTISNKSRGINFYLEKISDIGYEVDCLNPYSTAGDILPPYPYQWQVKTKIKMGDDDALEGIGETPLEAIRDLYFLIKKFRKKPCDDCEIMRFDDTGEEFEDCEECTKADEDK